MLSRTLSALLLAAGASSSRAKLTARRAQSSEDESVSLILNQWYSSCEIDGNGGACAGSTSPGPGVNLSIGPSRLDLSGNSFCYVNPIEETKSQVTWFGACPWLEFCDTAPRGNISVYTLFLNPQSPEYQSLLPTECTNGMCVVTEAIKALRGDEWWEDKNLTLP